MPIRVDVEIQEKNEELDIIIGENNNMNNNFPYISLRRLGEYIYEITFDKLPIYIPSDSFSAFGCSSFVRDGKLHRQLDWYYGKTAEFKINFNDVEGISFITGLNDGELIERKTLLSQLPYRICDGRNKHGIMVSTHVLFNDFNYYGSGNKTEDLTLLPFTILTTMSDINILSDEVNNLINNIKLNKSMREQDLLIQVLVTDGVTTKLFTPTENGYEYIDITSNPKVTNFNWVNRQNISRTDNDIQLRPTGIERWNLIDNDVSLEDLRFTLAYENSDRLSEFIGIDETTKYSSDEELIKIYNKAHASYLNRERNNKLWQSMHSIIYSKFKIESLFVQENYNKNYVKEG